MKSPALALAGALFVTARSAARLTAVVALPVLLAALGSLVELEAVAAVEIEVAVVAGSTVAVMRTTLDAPAAIVPSASGLDQAEPVLGSQAEARSTQYLAFCSWLGSVSASETAAASEGPPLETVIT